MSRTVTIDGADYTAKIRLEQFTFTECANRGEVGTGGFDLVDEASAEEVPALKATIFTETAASPDRAFTGFTNDRTTQRGTARVAGAREWSVELTDLNVLASDYIIDDTDVTRPAETDYARITWLLTTRFGTDAGVDAGVVPNTHTITMDPSDYSGKRPSDVLAECSEAAGKMWFIYNYGSGHKLYYDIATGTSLTSSAKISDVAADVDETTVFGPIGPPSVRRSADGIFSSIQVRYKNGTARVRNATTESNFRVKETSVEDDSITSHTLAVTKGQKFLDGAATEILQIDGLAVVLPRANVNDIRAGQRIQIKLSRHGISSYTYYRIIRRTVQALSGNGGASDVAYLVSLALLSDVYARPIGGRPSDDPTPPPMPDCGECQRRVILLPSGVDTALSMTSSARGNIHVYDGTTLIKYTCALDVIDQNDSAPTTLGVIKHEPGTHTSLSTGDEGLYGDPSQGDYGTAVYDISGDITPVSVDVTDRRTFWVTTGTGGASETDEEFGGGGSTDDWGSGLGTRWIGEITTGTPTWGVTSGAGWVQGGTGDTSVALNAYTRHGTIDVDWPDTFVDNNGGGGGASTDHTGWPTDAPWTQTDWEMFARFRVIDKTADTAIWLLNYKGFGAASANNNSVYIEPDGGEYSIVDKGGGLDSTTITLTDSAWYGIRWQRIGATARVRIWLYSGAEPGTWDLSVAKGSTVYSDFQLDHVIFDDARVEWDFIRFYYAGEGGLEYRSEETGVLLDSAALAVAPESSRRTPDGQHIFIQQGTDTLVRYNRRLELEDTVTISGFFPVQDWNADDQFNLFRLDGNVLYRYHADGTEAWAVDLNAEKNYRFPSLVASGGNGLQCYTGRSSGNGAVADGYVRVVGYIGGATWTDGSDACLLIIRRSDGTIEDERRWSGDSSDAAQAQAIVAHGNCLYIAGAADGATFEDITLSGQSGFLVRGPLGLTGSDGGVAGSGLSIGEDV
jgi:hypothetical protein